VQEISSDGCDRDKVFEEVDYARSVHGELPLPKQVATSTLCQVQ
jgi:hypothetical protein